MFRRTRYQQGSLQRAKRSGGPDAWIFRWYEDQPNGGKRYRKTVVGTVVQFPTETAARKAADALRIDINIQTPHASSGPTTVDQLIEHFRLKEMPRDDHERRSYSTKAAYECYLTNWISPKWGKHRIGEIKAVAVENWLGTIPRADGTKAKIRNIMSAVFNHAVRHEWLDKNPITLVRQSAKRESIPEILAVEEIRALLGELETAGPNPGAARRGNRSAHRGVARSEMAGRGFRESRIACSALGRSPGHRTLQNRGVR